MKITLIANDTTFIYNLRREVLMKLVEEGHQVTVLCQSLSYREALEQIGCKLYDIPIGRRSMNPLEDIRLFCKFFQILRTIKPDVVLHEEGLDQRVISKTVQYISQADVLIIGGTSLVVYPAAGLIDYFKGSHLILINKSKTERDSQADLIINDKIGEVFKQL